MNTLRAWARRIKRDGLTLWFARSHPATPWHAKALGALVVAYALSPIDLIPDFIPVLGYLDDVILLPPQVLADSRHQAEQWMAAQHRKPRSWVGGAVVVLIWMAAAVLVGWWALGQPRTAA